MNSVIDIFTAYHKISRTVLTGCIACYCWNSNWIHTLEGVLFVSWMFTRNEYNKYYVFSSSKHLRQHHLTYFSLKGFSGMRLHILWNNSQHPSNFTICLSNNLLSDFTQAILQLQNKAMETILWIHFLLFPSLRGNWVVHIRLDSGKSASSFWKCSNLLQRDFSVLIKCNE